MKTKFLVLLAASVLSGAIFLLPGTVSKAEVSESLAAPTFSAGERIQASGKDLIVPKDDGSSNIYSVPCVVDWNEDGKKDLLVGCFWNGYIFLYINSGTNNAPVFTTGSKLKADGADIIVSYG